MEIVTRTPVDFEIVGAPGDIAMQLETVADACPAGGKDNPPAGHRAAALGFGHP